MAKSSDNRLFTAKVTATAPVTLKGSLAINDDVVLITYRRKSSSKHNTRVIPLTQVLAYGPDKKEESFVTFMGSSVVAEFSGTVTSMDAAGATLRTDAGDVYLNLSNTILEALNDGDEGKSRKVKKGLRKGKPGKDKTIKKKKSKR